jgi:thiamine-phosphate diphosphorylase
MEEGGTERERAGSRQVELTRALRLMVITDRRLAGTRGVVAVVEAALAAGCRAIQLRDKEASARELANMGRGLLPTVRAAGALLLVNDRLDVAMAIGADGVHLGPEDLPVEAARSVAPPGFLIGFSTDSPDVAREAESEGADYLGCGAVFGTRTKDVGDEAIGIHRLDEVARSVAIPVVGIGGVTPSGAERIARETAAAGVAVVGAVMAAPDPEGAARRLLQPFRSRTGPG